MALCFTHFSKCVSERKARKGERRGWKKEEEEKGKGSKGVRGRAEGVKEGRIENLA